MVTTTPDRQSAAQRVRAGWSRISSRPAPEAMHVLASSTGGLVGLALGLAALEAAWVLGFLLLTHWPWTVLGGGCVLVAVLAAALPLASSSVTAAVPRIKARRRLRYPTLVLERDAWHTDRLEAPVGDPHPTDGRIPGLLKCRWVYLATVDEDGRYRPWDGSRAEGTSSPEELASRVESELLRVLLSPVQAASEVVRNATLFVFAGGLCVFLFLLIKG